MISGVVFSVSQQYLYNHFSNMSHIPVGSFFSSATSVGKRPLSSTGNGNRRSTSRLSGVPSSDRSIAEPLRDISEKNRENLVVSNREIRRLFDTMKELGDVIKQQNVRLESIEQKVKESRSEMVIAKKELRKMRDHAGQVAQKENTHHGPLPNELKGDVHLLHNKQDLDKQFRGSEGVDGPHNTEVRKFLYEELKKENSGHSKSSIMRAVTRYYETKRQQYLDSLPARKELVEKKQLDKKLTSRRRRT